MDVTRHEEEVAFATVAVPYERVRLRKEVVTEEVQVTVTVRREVLHVEREPLDRPDAFVPEARAFSDAVREIVLYAEVPVVSTQVVPQERVRVHRDIVEEEVPLTASRRIERVDVERDPAG